MYTAHYSTRVTPQNRAIPGSAQVANSAGGYSWPVDDWKRLDRFLILGSEGGSYYATEQALTVENAEAVRRCIETDGARAVSVIRDVSTKGRAYKNDPALFALAMACGLGSPETRAAAYAALPDAARIGTHLLHFAEYVQAFRGWGRGLRKAVAAWYQKDLNALAYQVVKYQQRDDWSHKDLLRLSHPMPRSEGHDQLFRWIVGKETTTLPPIVEGYVRAQTADANALPALIREYGLTREMLPTAALNSADVWGALLEKMPLTAMLRNLGKMSSIGLLAPLSEASKHVVAELNNAEHLRSARIHPFGVLLAATVYAVGHGIKGSLAWTPVPQVIDALNDAFYTTFGNIEPTGKNTLLAVDVSGSMDGSMVQGVMPARNAAAAMAMATIRTEPNYVVMAFGTQFVPLNISRGMRLADVRNATCNLGMMGTDCSLPMLYALKNKLPIETFVVFTDNETWAGDIHPAQALRQFREKMGIKARLVVAGMTSGGFTIADPNDAGMCDVVGFDADAPSAIAEFSRGNI